MSNALNMKIIGIITEPRKSHVFQTWVPVIDYEGLYEVSDFGIIRSLSRTWISGKGSVQFKPTTILKPNVNNIYNHVNLNKNGTVKHKTVHRIVLTSFYGHSTLFVLHRVEGNPLDCRLYNLKFGSHRENIIRYYSSVKKYSSATGVSFHKKRNEWRSFIRVNGKLKALGCFKNEKDAAFAYQKALKQIYEYK